MGKNDARLFEIVLPTEVGNFDFVKLTGSLDR
jgi:hypothetical protein